MDENTRLQVTAAAVSAVGPQSHYVTMQKNSTGDDIAVVDAAKWQQAVLDVAMSIVTMAGENGAVGRLISQMGNAKPFTGTVVAINKEERSTRGFVVLHTGTERKYRDIAGRDLPLGFESARTERTDNPAGRAVAQKLVGLVGHRVTVWVEREAIQGNTEGHTVRVIRHVEDLGVDRDAEAKVAALA